MSDSTPPENTKICAVEACQDSIGSADYSLCCEYCNSLFHHRCVGFSDSAYNAFSKLNTTGLISYFCQSCKTDIARFRTKSSFGDETSAAPSNIIDDRLRKVEAQLGNISSTLDVLTGRSAPSVPSDVSKSAPGAKSYASVAAKGVASESRVMTVSDLHKVQEEESHRRSIVVAGLPELGSDLEKVSELCRYLDPSSCVSDVFRMGRIPRSDSEGPVRPRLLKVHLPSSTVVKSLLGEARRLKDSSAFKGVFIRRSMTIEERQSLAEMRGRCRDLNNVKDRQDTKYVIVNEHLVRYTGCSLSNGRLVGGVRDRDWSDGIQSQDLNGEEGQINS